MKQTSKDLKRFDLHDFAQTRRQFIKTLGALSATALGLLRDDILAMDDLGVEFTHGVASGDPLADRVVIWSRAVSRQAQEFDVYWFVAKDPDMRTIVNSGSVRALAQFDYTLKIDVTQLSPGTLYYYQFIQGASFSPIGKTCTLAQGELAHSRLAVVSCANYVKGYFNAYAELAKRDDIEVVVHLGDYIYEYGPDGYLTPGNKLFDVPQPRLAELIPEHELLTLADYRARYALYRGDADLRELHRVKPFIAVWDDHEFADDAWKSGALNHNPESGEGDWFARRDAAIQAYYEWLPIREPASGERLTIYRSFDFGDLARMILLDTRLIARDQQLSALQMFGVYQSVDSEGRFPLDVTAEKQMRELLGADQKTWLKNQLQAAADGQTWQLLGQQVLFQFQPAIDIERTQIISDVKKQLLKQAIDFEYGAGSGAFFGIVGKLGGPNPAATDMWTGYPNAKQELAKLLALTPNPVLLTGDSHNAWAANLRLKTAQDIASIGVELGGPSISAPGIEELLPILTPEESLDLVLEASRAQSSTDQTIYAEMAHRGFLVLDITQQRVQGEWYFVDTVLHKNYTAFLGKLLAAPKDAKRFMPAISALFTGERLLIPVVDVAEIGRFNVEMIVSSSTHSPLELTLISALPVTDKSENPATFSFADKQLILPIVSYAGHFYTASLEFIPGSEPMRFSNLSYQEYPPPL